MKRHLVSLISLAFFLILATGSDDSDSSNPSEEITSSQTPCMELKNKCIDLLKRRGPEISDYIKREELNGSESISDEEQFVFALKGLALIAQIEEMENTMKQDCPDVFHEY